jgi:Putative 2OG-Fe(II) oxygenase
MTLKIAYFQPVVIAIDNIPPVEFSKIFNLAESLHSRPDLNDANNAISLRGGQQIQVYPNNLGIDVSWLVTWLETIAKGYMEIITQQSGTDELNHCKPVVVSIWTIKQTSGDYQEMHTHPAGNLSGNMYINAPELSPTSAPSDSQILFRLPHSKDITKFVMNDTWKYNPNPGTVILFPSHIPHTVYPWKGAGSRTVMAFDIRLAPKD